MSTREKILAWVRSQKNSTSANVAARFGISRQTAAAYLKELLILGKLVKSGSTRNATYQYSTTPNSLKEANLSEVKLVRKSKGLEEHQVFNEVDLKLRLMHSVSANVFQTLSYAFTEMLNNAIEHSGSKSVNISVRLDPIGVQFSIQDSGVGVFHKVKNKFRLRDEYQALEHILKGKQTTQPERHSGEGIFFTSKMADLFVLRSHDIQLTVNNVREDVSISKLKKLNGTKVVFQIKRRSRRTLQSIFEAYTNSDHEFDKTLIRVKLALYQGLLSRSQARRILMGLEKFKRIEFDFKGVTEIGQAFADEIFRVFHRSHPGIQLTIVQEIPAIRFMIGRVGFK